MFVFASCSDCVDWNIGRCEACRENWPIVQEMFDEAPRYRCENCRAPLATEDKFERKYITCCVCKHK